MMKKILVFLCLMTFMAASALAAKVDKTITLKVGGENRSFILYVPNNVKSEAPLVFSLHGTGGSSSNYSPFKKEVADKNGCIVVYPQGKSIYFPVFGGNMPGWHSTGETSEDIDFFKAIIEEVDKTYKVDRKRIYCCGFSNGGMMTYTVANVASDIFAAFASISGFPLNEFHLHHTSARPFPFLHIHGKADDFVKYSLVPIIKDNIVARNGCNPVPEVKTVSGKYRKSVYAATEGSFPYVYYEIDGMGHSEYTGNTEDGNSATTMWKFFSQYTLDTERDEYLKWRPNIDLDGWKPKEHGWTKSSTIVKFGGDQKTDANQNVYYSLQFETGVYKLCFKAEGTEGGTVSVKIRKLTGKKNYVVSQTVNVGEDNEIFFEVADGWGEYSITISRITSTEALNIKNLAIYAATEEEITGVSSLNLGEKQENNKVYTLDGREVKDENAVRGIYIKNGKKYQK